QRSQGIPMCSDDHALAAPNVGANNLPTVGKSPAGGVFQGLGQRDFLRAEVRVTRVFSGVTLVRGGECGWADVVAAAPEFDLLPTVLFGCLCLVESLQCSVMTFVEVPAAGDRDPHQVHLLKNDPEGLDRPFQHRGKSHVEDIPFAAQGAPSFQGLPGPVLAQRHVCPSGETVLLVPGTLTVSQQNNFYHPLCLLEPGLSVV